MIFLFNWGILRFHVNLSQCKIRLMIGRKFQWLSRFFIPRLWATTKPPPLHQHQQHLLHHFHYPSILQSHLLISITIQQQLFLLISSQLCPIAPITSRPCAPRSHRWLHLKTNPTPLPGATSWWSWISWGNEKLLRPKNLGEKNLSKREHPKNLWDVCHGVSKPPVVRHQGCH